MGNVENKQATAAWGQNEKRWLWGKRLLISTILIGLGGAAGFAGGVENAPAIYFDRIKHHRFNAMKVHEQIEPILFHVDATSEQKEKVSMIIRTSIVKIAGIGLKPWENHNEFLKLLQADKVDPSALEAIRARQVNQIDLASKSAVEAITKVALVLTSQQRRKLTEQWSWY